MFRIGAVLLSLLVIALLLEIGTRLFVPDSTFRVFSNVFARDPDPRVGYTLKHNYTGSAFGTDLVTNSMGYRGPELPLQKLPGTLRIALIGDSHAFGFGVPFAQTMGKLLSRRLSARLAKPVEVINFGVNGYNSKQELAVLETKALPFAPDLVLVLVCNNDEQPQMWVDDDGFLHWGQKGAHEAGSDIAWDRHQHSLADFQKQLFSASRFLLWLRLQWFRYSMGRAARDLEVAQGVPAGNGWTLPASVGPIDNELVEPVLTPLGAMVDMCRARKIKIVFLTFNGMTNWRQSLNAVAADKGVPLIELVSLLAADSWKELLEKWSLGWDSHMAAPAQEVWAAGVAEFLVKNCLVP